MKKRHFIGAFAGLALALWLVFHFGFDSVGGAVLSAGWRGLAAISAAHVFANVLCGLAWRALIVAPPPNATLACIWGRLLRDSVGNLIAVPAAGEFVAARELAFHGVPLGVAIGSTIVDLTMELASQVLLTATGVTVLVLDHPGKANIPWAATGIVACAAAIGGFVVAQRKGLFRFLETLTERLGLTAGWTGQSEAEGVHAAIQVIYRRRWRVLASGAVHFVAWIAGVGETWIGLWFMGHALPFADVLVIDSLVFALRSVSFFVPWAAGVQEGGYLLAGGLFGLAPEVALGLSLLKRAREIATAAPGILVWQGLEFWRLSRKIARSRAPS